MRELIAILATWRLTSLLHYEDGPYQVFERLRRKLKAFEEDKDGKPVTFLSGLVSCFACLSMWTAVVPALTLTWLDIIASERSNDLVPLLLLRTLAFSAGAIIIDRVIR